MVFIQPLDLETILVENLAGSWVIFIFLMIVLLSILAAKFRMPNSVFMVLFTLFCGMMSYYYPPLRVVTIIFVGFFVFYIIASRTKS